MKILIADDHDLVLKGMQVNVQEVLGSTCKISFATNGIEVIKKLEVNSYDMLITDLNMPLTDGLEMIANALRIDKNLKILVVTVNEESAFAPRFLSAGVFGYVNKNQPDEILKEAILRISQGKRFISDNLAETFANSYKKKLPDNPFDLLSTREFEVTNLLLKGFGAIEIANALSINTSTASSYRGRVFSKLGIKTLVDLIRLARQFRLLEDSQI